MVMKTMTQIAQCIVTSTLARIQIVDYQGSLDAHETTLLWYTAYAYKDATLEILVC